MSAKHGLISSLALLALVGCGGPKQESSKRTSTPAPVSRGTHVGGPPQVETQAEVEATEDPDLKRIMAEWRRSTAAVGVGAGVRLKGGKVLLAADGSETIGPGGAATALTADAPFQIGSVTKIFTSTLIVQAVEDGLLELDEPIQRWLKGVPNGDKITVRQLLNHTSGVPEYTTQLGSLAPAASSAPPKDVDEMISLAYRSQPSAPGGAHSYSNTNYIMLGAIIEQVRGASFADLVRERLLTPAGMTSSFLNSSTTPPLGPVPPGYAQGGAVPTEAVQLHGDWAWAAGAMVSTPEDLLRFFERLATGGYVTPSSLDLMTTGVPIPGSDATYGFALEVQQTPYGTVIGHTGLINGVQTVLGYLVELDCYFVVYSNTGSVDPSAVIPEIAALAKRAAP